MSTPNVKKLLNTCVYTSVLLLSACFHSDDDSSVTMLDNSGIYEGVQEYANGDVALVKLYLGQNGLMIVAVEDDDSQQNSSFYSAKVNESFAFDVAPTASADGRSLLGVDSGDALQVDIGSEGDSQLVNLSLSSESALGSGLANLTGKFAMMDNAGVQTYTIDAAGVLTIEGSCAGTGQVSIMNTAVNLYLLQVSGDCGEYQGFAYLSKIEVDEDVLHIIATNAQQKIDREYFRI